MRSILNLRYRELKGQVIIVGVIVMMRGSNTLSTLRRP